ncbi:hypothetical protein L1887_12561 [Cichorium endivia]|nr:hypothetical protein L1887_12561 [Cichorium endivia]
MHSNFTLQSPISKDDAQQLLLKINHKLFLYITLFLLAKESEKIIDNKCRSAKTLWDSMWMPMVKDNSIPEVGFVLILAGVEMSFVPMIATFTAAANTRKVGQHSTFTSW